VFLLSLEARRSGLDGLATAYNSIMEHNATIIICENNPKVSESGVSP